MFSLIFCTSEISVNYQQLNNLFEQKNLYLDKIPSINVITTRKIYDKRLCKCVGAHFCVCECVYVCVCECVLHVLNDKHGV